jgi:hypothetical protein
MAVTINASTSAGLVMTSDLSGVLTLQQNGVALPNGGVAPAFSAYQSSAQTLASATYTKIQFQSEDFDTANCFDSTTNYRFTPTVAGYYQSNFCFYCINGATEMLILLYKNGSIWKVGMDVVSTGQRTVVGSALVYLNGSTDYIEVYGYMGNGATLGVSTGQTYFQACLVRGA